MQNSWDDHAQKQYFTQVWWRALESDFPGWWAQLMFQPPRRKLWTTWDAERPLSSSLTCSTTSQTLSEFFPLKFSFYWLISLIQAEMAMIMRRETKLSTLCFLIIVIYHTADLFWDVFLQFSLTFKTMERVQFFLK